jgi:hypothetical protein
VRAIDYCADETAYTSISSFVYLSRWVARSRGYVHGQTRNEVSWFDFRDVILRVTLK